MSSQDVTTTTTCVGASSTTRPTYSAGHVAPQCAAAWALQTSKHVKESAVGLAPHQRRTFMMPEVFESVRGAPACHLTSKCDPKSGPILANQYNTSTPVAPLPDQVKTKCNRDGTRSSYYQ